MKTPQWHHGNGYRTGRVEVFAGNGFYSEKVGTSLTTLCHPSATGFDGIVASARK